MSSISSGPIQTGHRKRSLQYSSLLQTSSLFVAGIGISSGIILVNVIVALCPIIVGTLGISISTFIYYGGLVALANLATFMLVEVGFSEKKLIQMERQSRQTAPTISATTEYQTEIDNLTTQLVDQQRQIENLENELQTQREENVITHTRNQELNNFIETMQKQLESQRLYMVKLEKDNTLLKQECVKLRQTISSYEEKD